MRLCIDIVDQTETLTMEELQTVEGLLQFAAEEQRVPQNAEVSVTFVTNEDIRVINRDYRGKDQPTDVISFALEEMGEDEVKIVGAEVPPHLGDIIISVEKAREQAKDYGHSFQREIGFLALHGLLHLLGYDHMTEEDEKEMFSIQKEILEKYGLRRTI